MTIDNVTFETICGILIHLVAIKAISGYHFPWEPREKTKKRLIKQLEDGDTIICKEFINDIKSL